MDREKTLSDTKTIELEEALSVAVKAALEAGRIQQEYASTGFKVEHKGVIDLVTEVDLKCERAIVDIIGDVYPNHGILAEENVGDRTGSNYKWLIDPLDGTTNYTHGFPVYCASIGLEIDGDVALGVVYDPTRDELFSVIKGGGAFLNGEAITVSDTKSLENSLLATGFPYTIRTEKRNNIEEFTRMAMQAQAIRRPGAAAIDLCYVACGRLDGFWEFHLKPWDMAAGALIVEEAGGKVTGVDGARLDLYASHVVASNKVIHGAMLNILQEQQE